MKKALVHKTGSEAADLKILFRGVEKDDAEQLQASGVKDGSKVVLVEEPMKRVEQVEQPPVMTEEMAKSIAAVKAVSGEIDKLSDKVSVLEIQYIFVGFAICRRKRGMNDCALKKN